MRNELLSKYHSGHITAQLIGNDPGWFTCGGHVYSLDKADGSPSGSHVIEWHSSPIVCRHMPRRGILQRPNGILYIRYSVVRIKALVRLRTPSSSSQLLSQQWLASLSSPSSFTLSPSLPQLLPALLLEKQSPNVTLSLRRWRSASRRAGEPQPPK